MPSSIRFFRRFLSAMRRWRATWTTWFPRSWHRLSNSYAILPVSRVQKNRGTPIPEEFRFAKLKWKIDRLATEAWQNEECLQLELTLNPAIVSSGSPEKAIEAILNHVRRVAPGFSVPLHVPRVETGGLIAAGGQFKTSDGWVALKLANHLLLDHEAVAAILAHEACHYILENSGIRESTVDENEKLTDVCLFADSVYFFSLDTNARSRILNIVPAID